MYSKNLIYVIMAGVLILAGCASPKVNYVDPNAVNNLTTNFTQNDLRATAQDLAIQLIQSGKMRVCKSFTISPIKNATDQYVDTSVMANAMADKLTNSSAIDATYVVSSEEMNNQTEELNRQSQANLYDKNSVARMGKMKGAQCRIDGKLTSDTSLAPDGKTTLVAYTFFVQMIDVEQGATVWRNSKNISKGLSY